MKYGNWLSLALVLATAPPLLGATKDQALPDKEMLKLMEFLREMEMIKQMEMMTCRRWNHRRRSRARRAKPRQPRRRQPSEAAGEIGNNLGFELAGRARVEPNRALWQSWRKANRKVKRWQKMPPAEKQECANVSSAENLPQSDKEERKRIETARPAGRKAAHGRI
jgi:hypothetical protein